MKIFFSEHEINYDGSQLCGQYAYMNFGVLGDSIISWIGPCNIPYEHMVDGEDVRAQSEIRSARMVHFIIEKFSIDLFSGVSLQRLLAALVIDLVKEISPNKNIVNNLRRDGDDVFHENKKLSISVATKSLTSTLIHFAINVVNDDTPVPTLSLTDLQVEPITFSKELMIKFASEVISITEATQKVRGV